MSSGHLQIVVCGASPAADVTHLVRTAQEQDWTAAVSGSERQKAFPWTAAFEAAVELAQGSRPAASGPA